MGFPVNFQAVVPECALVLQVQINQPKCVLSQINWMTLLLHSYLCVFSRLLLEVGHIEDSAYSLFLYVCSPMPYAAAAEG